MGAIDWGLIQPTPGPAREVASISSLLSALADRRAKQQAAAAEQDFRERQFAAQQENTRIDNARLDEELHGRQTHQANETQRLKDEEAARRLQKANEDAARALKEQVLPALDDDRPDKAQVAAQAAGIGMETMQEGHGPGYGDNQLAPGQAPAAPQTRHQFKLPAGGIVDYDPQEARAAEKARSQRLQGRVHESLDGLDLIKTDPLAKKAYDDTMSTLGLAAKPEDVQKLFQENLRAYRTRADENMRAELQRQASAHRLLSSDEWRRLAALDRHESLENRNLAQWKDTVKWGTIQTGGRKLHAAIENLASDDPKDALKHRDATIQLGGFFRGTTPTEGEMHYLYTDLGGRLGNAWPAFKARMLTGDLSPVEMEMVRASAKTAHEEWLRNVEDARASVEDTYGDDASVMKKAKGMFRSLGYHWEARKGTPSGDAPVSGDTKKQLEDLQRQVKELTGAK